MRAPLGGPGGRGCIGIAAVGVLAVAVNAVVVVTAAVIELAAGVAAVAVVLVMITAGAVVAVIGRGLVDDGGDGFLDPSLRGHGRLDLSFLGVQHFLDPDQNLRTGDGIHPRSAASARFWGIAASWR